MGEPKREAQSDLAALGAPAELIAQLEEASRPADFEVFQENWETVQVFLRLNTQWRYLAGYSQATCLGLDYNSMDFVFKILGIKKRREVFDGLQIMEAAALDLINTRGP
jgi:hypothetical protein